MHVRPQLHKGAVAEVDVTRIATKPGTQRFTSVENFEIPVPALRRLCHEERLISVRRARDVGNHATYLGGRYRAVEKLALQTPKRTEVPGLLTPP